MGVAEFFDAELDVKRALTIEPKSADVLALSRKLKVC
jgi:hypothetical protein